MSDEINPAGGAARSTPTIPQGWRPLPSLREAAEALLKRCDNCEVNFAEREALRLALSREDVVPEGWVLAPREPTPQMIEAARQSDIGPDRPMWDNWDSPSTADKDEWEAVLPGITKAGFFHASYEWPEWQCKILEVAYRAMISAAPSAPPMKEPEMSGDRSYRYPYGRTDTPYPGPPPQPPTLDTGAVREELKESEMTFEQWWPTAGHEHRAKDTAKAAWEAAQALAAPSPLPADREAIARVIDRHAWAQYQRYMERVPIWEEREKAGGEAARAQMSKDLRESAAAIVAPSLKKVDAIFALSSSPAAGGWRATDEELDRLADIGAKALRQAHAPQANFDWSDDYLIARHVLRACIGGEK
jgi:hypothetical protein